MRDPGTIPPHRSIESSTEASAILDGPSVVRFKIEETDKDFHPAFFVFPAFGSSFDSTREFHSPQLGHFPAHFG
jgi:hypothetical protein